MIEQKMIDVPMEEAISIREIFRIIKARIVIIIISTCVCFCVAGIVTYFVITPKYSSSAQLIVKLPKTDSINPNVNDVNFTIQMITTYKGIIKSNFVLDEVQNRLAEQGEFQGTTEELRGMLDVTQEQNSQIFSVNVKSAEAYQARAIANTTAEVFKDKLKEVQDIKNVEILSPAKASSKQISPNNKLNILLGAVVGVLLGVALAFLVELLDRTVKDEHFIVETLHYTNLGTVPHMNERELNARITKKTVVVPNTKTLRKPHAAGDAVIKKDPTGKQ